MAVRLYICRDNPDVVRRISSGEVKVRERYINRLPHEQRGNANDPMLESIEKIRNLCLDVYWNMALFVVSQEFREDPVREAFHTAYESPATWSIVGARPLGSLRDNGRPLRYSKTDDLKRVADVLDEFSFDRTISTIDTSTITQNTYYRADPRNEANHNAYRHLFENLRAYVNLAVENEEVLIYHVS
jgi:hypothetical protein